MKHKSHTHPQRLKNRIEKACEGLVFISETDAPIEAFLADGVQEPTAEELMLYLGSKDKAATESSSADEFFYRLTRVNDWHSKEQNRSAERFKKLEKLLEKELDDIRVISIGRIRIEIYVIGRSKNGEVAGIKTFAVET